MVQINSAVLSAVSAVQASRVIDTQGGVNITMCTVTTGTITGGVIKLQGSPDSTNWADFATRTLTAGGVFFDPAPTSTVTAVRYIRANITTAIARGGTVTVYLTIGAQQPGTGVWISP